MAAGTALCGAGDLSCDLLALQLCGHRPPRGRRTTGTRKGCTVVRHRVGALRQRPAHRALAHPAPSARTALVAADALLLLRRRQRPAGRGGQPRRCGLFPLYAETFHGRRDLLRRQRQFAATRRQIHGREHPPAARRDRPDRSAGAGRRPQGAPRTALPSSALLLWRRYGSARRRRPALRSGNAGGGHAHDAPRHALQRHALRLRQRPRQPDPLEPLLHPAHRGVGRKDQLRTLLRSGRTGRYLHARPPSRLGRRGTARRTQRGGLRHGEHVGRTLGPPPSRTLRRPAGQGLHAVSGFAHAGGLLLRTHVRQRHPFDSGAARRTGIDPLVQDPPSC